jgi:hypothetical protein
MEPCTPLVSTDSLYRVNLTARPPCPAHGQKYQRALAAWGNLTQLYGSSNGLKGSPQLSTPARYSINPLNEVPPSGLGCRSLYGSRPGFDSSG